MPLSDDDERLLYKYRSHLPQVLTLAAIGVRNAEDALRRGFLCIDRGHRYRAGVYVHSDRLADALADAQGRVALDAAKDARLQAQADRRRQAADRWVTALPTSVRDDARRSLESLALRDLERKCASAAVQDILTHFADRAKRVEDVEAYCAQQGLPEDLHIFVCRRAMNPDKKPSYGASGDGWLAQFLLSSQFAFAQKHYSVRKGMALPAWEPHRPYSETLREALNDWEKGKRFQREQVISYLRDGLNDSVPSDIAELLTLSITQPRSSRRSSRLSGSISRALRCVPLRGVNDVPALVRCAQRGIARDMGLADTPPVVPGEAYRVTAKRALRIQRERYGVDQRLAGTLRQRGDPWSHLRLAAKWVTHAPNGRRITAYLGPTNSGKTHRALQDLSRAPSGAALAPLRLLAAEHRDRLVGAGLCAGLHTGEEHEVPLGATHIAYTAEAYGGEPTHTLLVDEGHLACDPDRGWAWTQALLGGQCEHLVLTGEAWFEDTLRGIAHSTGATLNVVHTQRLAPLTVGETVENLETLPARTACIAFSRRAVLTLRDYLVGKGRTVACVYGALSPATRHLEAARFASGAADLLIATDAIGMGLNLPIDRIVLCQNQKFDGKEYRDLLPHEVRQIAGRAGRYGMGGSSGIVHGYAPRASSTAWQQFFEKALTVPPTVGLSQLRVLPSTSVLLAAKVPGVTVAQLLGFLHETAVADSTMSVAPASRALVDRQKVAQLATGLSWQDQVLFSSLPAQAEADATILRALADVIARRQAISVPPPPDPRGGGPALEMAEATIRRYDILIAAMYRWPFLGSVAEVTASRQALSEAVASVVASATRTVWCRACGGSLPPLSRFAVHDHCRTRVCFDDDY